VCQTVKFRLGGSAGLGCSSAQASRGRSVGGRRSLPSSLSSSSPSSSSGSSGVGLEKKEERLEAKLESIIDKLFRLDKYVDGFWSAGPDTSETGEESAV
jgi:hypothetical protein